MGSLMTVDGILVWQAEPCDVFDAGGMHVTTPVACRRRTYWHKSAKERALGALELLELLETAAVTQRDGGLTRGGSWGGSALG